MTWKEGLMKRDARHLLWLFNVVYFSFYCISYTIFTPLIKGHDCNLHTKIFLDIFLKHIACYSRMNFTDKDMSDN